MIDPRGKKAEVFAMPDRFKPDLSQVYIFNVSIESQRMIATRNFFRTHLPRIEKSNCKRKIGREKRRQADGLVDDRLSDQPPRKLTSAAVYFLI